MVIICYKYFESFDINIQCFNQVNQRNHEVDGTLLFIIIIMIMTLMIINIIIHY